VYLPGESEMVNFARLLALTPMEVPLIVMDENGSKSPFSLKMVQVIF
jgi:hypothetical protein